MPSKLFCFAVPTGYAEMIERGRGGESSVILKQSLLLQILEHPFTTVFLVLSLFSMKNILLILCLFSFFPHGVGFAVALHRKYEEFQALILFLQLVCTQKSTFPSPTYKFSHQF